MWVTKSDKYRIIDSVNASFITNNLRILSVLYSILQNNKILTCHEARLVYVERDREVKSVWYHSWTPKLSYKNYARIMLQVPEIDGLIELETKDIFDLLLCSINV